MAEELSPRNLNKRMRDDDISHDTKRFKDADIILEILDDDDVDSGVDRLDDVIKSLEEEVIVTSDAKHELDIGFLLEASDDELGLPPAFSSASCSPVTDGGGCVLVENEGFDRIWGFEDDLIEFGIQTEFCEGDVFDGGDGLFDLSDVGFGPLDYAL